jgi:hypothetical protein
MLSFWAVKTQAQLFVKLSSNMAISNERMSWFVLLAAVARKQSLKLFLAISIFQQ